MSDDTQAHVHAPSARKRFLVLIGGAVLVSMFMVYVAMGLYRSSGTSQLDLSRPGFDSAREEATRDRTVFDGFSPDGPIDEQVLEEFDRMYKDKAGDELLIDAFSSRVLSDKALSLD